MVEWLRGFLCPCALSPCLLVCVSEYAFLQIGTGGGVAQYEIFVGDNGFVFQPNVHGGRADALRIDGMQSGLDVLQGQAGIYVNVNRNIVTGART